MRQESEKKSLRTTGKSGDSTRIKESLTWPEKQKEGKAGVNQSSSSGSADDADCDMKTSTTGGANGRVLIRKGELGRPFKRGFDLPDGEQPVPFLKPKDEGSVREALLGWPGCRVVKTATLPNETQLELVENTEMEVVEMSNVDTNSCEKSKPNYKNIRHNKTYEMRSNKQTQKKASTDPKDLWQISRFKENAKSNVASFRT